MIKIEVRISENSTPEEREKLYIDEEDARAFLGKGYAEGIYEAEFVHHFPPRVISPDQIQVLIQLGEIVGGTATISLAIKSIVDFLEKTKGYRVDINLSGKRNGKDVEVSAHEVKLSDVTTVLEKLEKDIFDDIKFRA